MKKYLTLLPFLIVGISGNLYAGTVSVSDAQNVALNFFKVHSPSLQTRTPLTATLKYTRTQTDNTVDFYVFDLSPVKGFVIVAGDDNVIPVLGYSTESNFNTEFNHIGLRRWMNKTSANILIARQNNAVADARINGQWLALRQGQNPAIQKSTPLGPLCTTTWDQENDVTAPPPFLYNLFCPYNSHAQQGCLTGCVATAQAQIMKYWNYPASGVDSFSYDDTRANGYTGNYGVQSSDFAAHSYQWPLMPSVLTGDEPLAQDSAVDLLMYDCAVSVGMDFGDDNQDGSGANALLAEELPTDSFCSQYALVKYFSYNPDSINGVFEASYSDSAWIALIEHELNVGRPVLYEGDDASQGGHAWVCDGYDVFDYLHMNWGWSGVDNGYFAIGNLTTYGTGEFDPVLDDDALIGILPMYPIAPLAKFAASTTSTCSGTVQFTDFSQDLPTSWLWNFGDGTTSTLQSPQHTYATSGTYSVILTATNPAGSTSDTVSNYVSVNLLAAPVAASASAATPQSFSLSATASNTVGWFDSTGALVSGSNPFVTPVLNNTITYYVEDSVVNPSYHVGPVNNQIGTGDYFPDPFATQFNVFKPCFLVSVYLYAETATNRTIVITDSMGNTVAQRQVFCPAGGATIPLHLNLNPGIAYLIGVSDTSGINMFMDTLGANYPYSDSDGLVTITGNTSYFPTVSGYFYDWVVKEPDCTSQRVAVTATVISSISPVNNTLEFSIYPNPAANEAVLQTSETGTGLIWNVRNVLDQTVLNKSVDATETHVDLSNFANGVYIVELRQGEKAGIKKLIVSR